MLCLEGIVETVSLRFALGPGTLVAGSDRACDLVIPVQGVSRRHLVFEVDGTACLVRDLGSKNGSSINGHALTATRSIAAGDEIRLGPVALKVCEIDPADTELAIELHHRTSRSSQGTALSTASQSFQGLDPSSTSLLDLVPGLSRHLLARDDPQVQDALDVMRDRLSASSLGVFRIDDHEPPVVLWWSGSTPPKVDLRAAMDQAVPEDDIEHWLMTDGENAQGVVLSARPGKQLGLLVCGTAEPPGAVRLLLATVLRMLVEVVGPDHGHARRRSTPASSNELVFAPDEVRGVSVAMREAYAQLLPLLRGSLAILVTGETGVGKEHLVRLFHRSSDRTSGPLVAVNCAAIPADLLEAELFGIGRGVATGVSQRIGKLEQADGGVVFLDEIGDMSLDLQAKLLRALQENEVHPVGAATAKKIDVRVVAATNTDIEEKIGEGLFRRDLYYRLAGATIEVPPLRRRAADIMPLARYFMQFTSEELDKPVLGLTVKALRLLQAYPWPGNVRELEHVVRRLVHTCGEGQAIDSGQLPAHVAHPSPGAPAVDDGASDLNLAVRVGALESELIRAALHRSGGNKTLAASMLGLSRAGLRMKMKRLGLNH